MDTNWIRSLIPIITILRIESMHLDVYRPNIVNALDKNQQHNGERVVQANTR